LGDSSDQVKDSIASIKQLERTRNLVFLNKNLLDDDSLSFVLKNASNLSADLIDEGDKAQEDHVPIKNTKKVKVKGSRLTVRRSSRIKKINSL
jgi:hypothetical protein